MRNSSDPDGYCLVAGSRGRGLEPRARLPLVGGHRPPGVDWSPVLMSCAASAWPTTWPPIPPAEAPFPAIGWWPGTAGSSASGTPGQLLRVNGRHPSQPADRRHGLKAGATGVPRIAAAGAAQPADRHPRISVQAARERVATVTPWSGGLHIVVTVPGRGSRGPCPGIARPNGAAAPHSARQVPSSWLSAPFSQPGRGRLGLRRRVPTPHHLRHGPCQCRSPTTPWTPPR
jgi:hypothetical protein